MKKKTSFIISHVSILCLFDIASVVCGRWKKWNWYCAMEKTKKKKNRRSGHAYTIHNVAKSFHKSKNKIQSHPLLLWICCSRTSAGRNTNKKEKTGKYIYSEQQIFTHAFITFTMNSAIVSKLSRPTRTSIWYSLSQVSLSCTKSNV